MVDRIERTASRLPDAALRALNYDEAKEILRTKEIPPAVAAQAYATLALVDAIQDLRAEIAERSFAALSNEQFPGEDGTAESPRRRTWWRF